MASIIEALDSLASIPWQKDWQRPAWKQFISTGDEKLLGALPKFGRHDLLPEALLAALPSPQQMDESGKRFFQACSAAQHPSVFAQWIQKWASPTGASSGQFAKACAVVMACGCTKQFLASQFVGRMCSLEIPGGSVSPVGHFLLSLENRDAKALYRSFDAYAGISYPVAFLFAKHAPQRWKAILEEFEAEDSLKGLRDFAWVAGLKADPSLFLEVSARAFDRLEDWYARFGLGAKLCELDPARFGAAMDELTTRQLLVPDTHSKKTLGGQAWTAAVWLVNNRGLTALPPLIETAFSAELATVSWDRKEQSKQKNEALDRAVEKLGREAIPLLEACFATDQPEVQLHALQLWGGLKSVADTERIAAKLRQLFANADNTAVARAVRLSGELALEAVEPELWGLLGHKSRPVRDAAATTLAKLGESRLLKAAELWAARRADSRIATVSWLKALGSAKASDILKARLRTKRTTMSATPFYLGSKNSAAARRRPARMNDRSASGRPCRRLTARLFPGLTLEVARSTA